MTVLMVLGMEGSDGSLLILDALQADLVEARDP